MKRQNIHHWLVDHSKVWLAAPGAPPPPGGPAPGPDDMTDEDRAVMAERRRQRTERERASRLQNGLQNSKIDSFLKQRLKAYLRSGNPEKVNLVDKFLKSKVGPQEIGALETQMNTIDDEDRSWAAIFEHQRAIRDEIHLLQWRTEDYAERMPYRRKEFAGLMEDVKTLNSFDDSIDRGLKRLLLPFTKATQSTATPPVTIPPVLQPAEAIEIYEISPSHALYDEKMADYKGRFTTPEQKKSFQDILLRKKEELEVEKRFEKFDKAVSVMIQESLDKVRLQGRDEEVLDLATASIGITIAVGTRINWQEPDTEAIDGVGQAPATIERIEMSHYPIYDSGGHQIMIQPGVPIIHLRMADGNLQTHTMSRFKKWVDAVDAVEEVPNDLAHVEQMLDLPTYGVHIQPGLTITAKQFQREKDGAINWVPTYTNITDVRNGRVYFDLPVQFAPGFENLDEFEMRSDLTFAEFIKWWRRYSVEKAISQDELKENLKIYNEQYNHRYGLTPDQNLPIEVVANEDLRYPDELGTSISISSVTPEGVTLSDGTSLTFPHFFSWVKLNSIEKVPPRKKNDKEKKDEEEIKQDVAEKATFDEARKRIKDDLAEKKKGNIKKHEADRKVQTPLDRLKEIWYTTQFLSFKDLGGMIHEVVEFIKRKHERRSKGRFAEAGKRLPWILSTEFERIKEEAEHGETGKYKEAMEHWGIPEVKETLYKTNSKDIAKAAIQTLVHKGEMRWDDPKLWVVLNRLTARYTMKGSELYIPAPEFMPPGQSGEDMFRDSVDALWGKGTGSEWFVENTSKFNSSKQSWAWEFKQLENDPRGNGGLRGFLNAAIIKWRDKGEYVNPMEYEAILDGALDAGKLSAEEKMFFIFAGVLAREHNHHDGETLLHIDRIGELNSKYIGKFPLLDFFTQVKVPDPLTGKDRALNLKDLEEMRDEYFAEDFKVGKPGKGFSRFMWEVMLMSDPVRTRISKVMKNADQIDHDDAHLFIPPASPNEINDLTLPQAGNKKYFTSEGFMNTYPGFNQYIVSLTNAHDAATDDTSKKAKVASLRDAINSFIRIDTVLDGRFDKKNGQRTRLDQHHYAKKAVTDGSVTVGFHQKQMRNLILEIGRAYGQDFAWLYGPKTGSLQDRGEEKKQNEYEKNVENIKEVIIKMIEGDGGAKALDVIKKAKNREIDSEKGLRGIQDSARPELAKIREMRGKALHTIEEREKEAVEGHKPGAHGGHGGDHGGGH